MRGKLGDLAKPPALERLELFGAHELQGEPGSREALESCDLLPSGVVRSRWPSLHDSDRLRRPPGGSFFCADALLLLSEGAAVEREGETPVV